MPTGRSPRVSTAVSSSVLLQPVRCVVEPWARYRRPIARPTPVEKPPNRPCHQAVPGCPLLPRCSSPGDPQRAQRADTRQSMPVHLVTPSSTTQYTATPPRGPHDLGDLYLLVKNPNRITATGEARSPAGCTDPVALYSFCRITPRRFHGRHSRRCTAPSRHSRRRSSPRFPRISSRADRRGAPAL